MACAMLVSANLWADDVATLAALQEAIDNTAAGGTVNIRLTNDISIATTDMPIRIYGNYADAGKTVNLDLNGHNIVVGKGRAIELLKGTLNITGEGEIRKTDKGGKVYANASGNKEMVLVAGSWNTADANWSNLTIGKDVKLNATVAEGKAVSINEIAFTQTNTAAANYTITNPMEYVDKTKDAVKFTTPAYYKRGGVAIMDYCTDWKNYTSTGAKSTKNIGKAYGVNVHIYGYVYGQEYGVKINGIITMTDGDNVPMVHIYPGAEVASDKTVGSNAVYCSGYGKTIIEGTVHGANGVYVKGGDVTLNDAVIYSEFNGTYTEPVATNSGVTSAGSGVVIESSGNYVGQHSVVVSGDTKITGGSGYAIEETVTNSADSKVESVKVEGGTIEAGAQGAVIVDERTADEDAKIVIVGGNLDNNIKIKNGETVTPATVETFLPEGEEDHYKTTAVTDEAGKTTIVVTYFENTADKPVEKTSVVAAPDNTGVAWISTADVEETLIEDKELTYLEAIDNDHKQVLNVGDEDHNVTLIVGRIVLGPKAKIVVAAGSTLIVDGEQGIVANVEDNLVLKTKEGKPAIFLFNPAVTSNRHPKATVEFVSKSYRKSSSSLAWQRFGIPTNGVTSIVAKYNDTEVSTAFDFFNYDNNAWEVAGYIHTAGKTMDYTKMANAFEYFQLLNNTPEMGTVVTMTGNLVGNANPQLNVRGTFWNGYANSFMGRMSIMELIDMIPNTVDKAIYLYDINSVQATWEPLTLMDAEGMFIDPMQPFLIRNTKAAADVEVDYAEAVYNPAVNPTAAPARRVASDMTRAKLVVRGEGCIDRVTVAESDMFTADFDNGYDAAKYMNDGINMYVSAAEKMSIYATDNLENTYVGVASVNGGTYTISFEKVAGENLTLIDLATGAQVAMTEGNVYEFNVAANTVNDYRFQIVGRAQVATDVETISAANNGAVYTIMGQYVGQISEWNNLPAGIYVVDGVKRVK